MDIALTKTQLRFALTVQDDIDKYGSALVPAQVLRDYFKDNVPLLAQIMQGNSWQPRFDSLLDLTTIVQTDVPPLAPIRNLGRLRKKPA